MIDLPSDAIAILDRLVAFDTVSRNPNRAIIDWIRDYLAGHGVVAELLPNEDGTKANLFATIAPPDGPADGGLVLSGHTDVVPVDGQDWQHDPFRLTEEGGRLYGRGTTDMKGYLACVLALVPRLIPAELRVPVHLAISYDEEVGCLGVPFIVEHIHSLGLRPEIAFVGEPSRMGVVNGHKGSAGMLTEVTGLSCHSSRTDLGVSAVFAASDIIQELRRRAEALAAAPDSLGVFDPPYSTVSVGVVRAGTARNAIPGDCRIEWDIRETRPGVVQSVQEGVQAFIDADVLPAMRARYPEAAVETRAVYDVPALLPEGGAAEALAKRLTGTNASGTVPYGSEAGYFQRAGISTVIVGPGDIAQAHTADEWIARSEIEACCAFLGRLADHVHGR
jgi:acetylornithine deacetylase